jgi:hypothetical protein
MMGDPYFHIFVPAVDSLDKRCSVSQFKEYLERYFERRKGIWVHKQTREDLSSFRLSYPLLVFASTYGQTEFIKLLVEEFGCNVNVVAMPTKQSKLHHKRTALHNAVLCGHVEAVATLLRLGANVNIKDGAGMTPMDLLESRSAFNSLGQACSYEEIKDYDAADEQVEARKKARRHIRINLNFSDSQRAEMKALLLAEQASAAGSPTMAGAMQTRPTAGAQESSGGGRLSATTTPRIPGRAAAARQTYTAGGPPSASVQARNPYTRTQPLFSAASYHSQDFIPPLTSAAHTASPYTAHVASPSRRSRLP